MIGPPDREELGIQTTGHAQALLRRWHTGDRDAEARLFEVLMPDLHRIAAGYFRRERQGHTLRRPRWSTRSLPAGSLSAKHVDWQDRGHFFVIAARIMRRCSIDHARSRPAGEFMSIEGLPPASRFHTNLEVALAVDRLLEEFAARRRAAALQRGGDEILPRHDRRGGRRFPWSDPAHVPARMVSRPQVAV